MLVKACLGVCSQSLFRADGQSLLVNLWPRPVHELVAKAGSVVCSLLAKAFSGFVAEACLGAGVKSLFLVSGQSRV